MNSKEKNIVTLIGLMIAIIGIAFLVIVFLEKKSYASTENSIEHEELAEPKYYQKTAQDYAEISIEEMSFSDSGKTSSNQKQETEETEVDGDYIIPESETRELDESDLEGLSKDELMKARNEIYARHGRKFDDDGLQKYFDSKTWYEGIYEPEDFPENELSELERKNAAFILNYEKEKGYE